MLMQHFFCISYFRASSARVPAHCEVVGTSLASQTAILHAWNKKVIHFSRRIPAQPTIYLNI